MYDAAAKNELGLDGSELIEGGVRYSLPQRDLGKTRQGGWVLFVFGLFGVGFMCIWMGFPIREGLKLIAKEDWFGLALLGFGALGLFGLIPMLGLCLGGLTLLANKTQCTVEVRDGKLYSKERLLLFTWPRKRRVTEIQRLRVSSDTSPRRDAESLKSWLGENVYALLAETPRGKPFIVAPGYPHALLVRLAKDLAPRIEAELAYADVAASEPEAWRDETQKRREIEVLDDDGKQSDRRSIPQQPAGSLAQIKRLDAALTIHIPPVGIRKGSKGLIYFSLIWNALVSVFIVMAILTLFGKIDVDGDLPAVGILLFMIPFILVGVATLLASINMGRRQASLAVAHGSLFVVRQSIFGKKQREWSDGEIERICVGPSGMEVNDVPVNELQVHPHSGKKFGLLSQLEDDELDWIACELNQALGLPTADFAGE